MRSRVARLVAIWAFAVLIPITAHADGGLVKKKSAFTVAETLDRLSERLTGAGITVFARIDHAAGAAKIDDPIPPSSVLIFGNPKLGTPLMKAAPEIGLDLPLKALAYQDGNGDTWLVYTHPDALKARYSVAGADPVFAKMTGALDKLTDAAVTK